MNYRRGESVKCAHSYFKEHKIFQFNLPPSNRNRMVLRMNRLDFGSEEIPADGIDWTDSRISWVRWTSCNPRSPVLNYINSWSELC